jgi:hypothetical protein
MLSSNTLMSMKIERSLDNLFMFRESEKSLKRSLGGSFLYNFVEPEKVIKVCSITLSCIFERENGQRPSSRFCAKNHKKQLKHAMKKRKIYVSLRMDIEFIMSAKSHPHRGIRH